jgi:hypothetical protein
MASEASIQGARPTIVQQPLIPASKAVGPMQPVVTVPRNKRIPLTEHAARRAIDSRGTPENHQRGILGEWAVSRLLGIEDRLDTEVYEYGDSGVDLRYHGKTIDVKTVGPHASNPELWVDLTQSLNAEYYVLAQQVSTARLRVIGYAPREAVANAYERDISSAVDWHAERVRAVPQDELYPIPWTAAMFG